MFRLQAGGRKQTVQNYKTDNRKSLQVVCILTKLYKRWSSSIGKLTSLKMVLRHLSEDVLEKKELFNTDIDIKYKIVTARTQSDQLVLHSHQLTKVTNHHACIQKIFHGAFLFQGGGQTCRTASLHRGPFPLDHSAIGKNNIYDNTASAWKKLASKIYVKFG